MSGIEQLGHASFAALRERYEVTPIKNCPGRYIIRGAERHAVEALVGEGVRVTRFVVAAAPDSVHVARLEGGGVISYEKPDGTFVHTLCDASGFARKLTQLGIDL